MVAFVDVAVICRMFVGRKLSFCCVSCDLDVAEVKVTREVVKKLIKVSDGRYKINVLMGKSMDENYKIKRRHKGN